MRLEAEAVAIGLGGRQILRIVSAHVAAGELVGIIGPNGAGKSTLLKAMAGVLRPAGGRIALDGADCAGLARSEMARRVAYLPQSRIVHWPVTVETLVALGRLPYHGFAVEWDADDRVAIDRALGDLQVAHLRKRLVSELSGGELARVLVARSLAQQPRILLADEPSAGLDPAHQLALFRHLRSLAESGMGVLVALHDLSAAARFCHRLILMKDGEILADGRPDMVLTPELMRRAFDVAAVHGTVDGVPVVIAH
ncbi:MAG: ABC transporter ATP-binding protein [Hyphomicrobiaceae bacterium]